MNRTSAATTDTPKRRRFGEFHHWYIAAFLGLFLLVSWSTLSDYGVIWDAPELHIGDRYLYYFLSFDSEYLDFDRDVVELHQRDDHPDFHRFSAWLRERPHHVWPVGPLAVAASKHVLFTKLGLMEPIDAGHAVLPLFAAGLMLAVFFLHRHCGLWAAVIATVCIATHPRFFAHLHNNLKDVPSCLTFALVIFVFYEATRRMSPGLMWLAAALWGVALARRANALFLPFIVGPFFLLELYLRRGRGETVLPRRMWPPLLLYPLAGFLTMCLLWPLMFFDFPLHLERYVSHLFAKGTEGTPDWNLMPLLHAVVTTPVPMLLLLLAGIATIVVRIARDRRIDSLHLLLLLWLIVPVLRVSLPHTHDYDGIRHWLEFVPAAAVIAGIGGGAIIERFGGRFPRAALLLAVFVWFGPVIAWNVRNHPLQLAYFNSTIGGLAGAQQRGLPEATDYFGHSYRRGVEWLNANAPTDSMLLVCVGQRMVHMTESIWMRDDIVNVSCLTETDDRRLDPRVLDVIETYPGEVFVMYVTRVSHYPDLIRDLDATSTPVHQLLVDGAPVLKIHRLEKGTFASRRGRFPKPGFGDRNG